MPLTNRGRPATSKELQERISSLLGEGERKLLVLLIASYPETFSRVELARQGGYSNAKSGGFAAPLARLIELGFVEAVKNGVVRGSDMLFLRAKSRKRAGGACDIQIWQQCRIGIAQNMRLVIGLG